MNQKTLMFAYGMNTNLSSMRTRCPAADVVGVAELQDHALEFAYHCNVVPATGQSVPGLLWAITDQDLGNLDAAEGYPHYYTRKDVTVDHNGKQTLAMVYVMVGSTSPSPPSEHYWNLVRTGYQENAISQRELTRALNNSYELSNS